MNKVKNAQSKINELEAKLKKVEQENLCLRTAIDSLSAIVYWKDLDGHYLGCNKFAVEYAMEHGVNSAITNTNDVIGLTDENIFDKATAKQYNVQADILTALKGDGS